MAGDFMAVVALTVVIALVDVAIMVVEDTVPGPPETAECVEVRPDAVVIVRTQPDGTTTVVDTFKKEDVSRETLQIWLEFPCHDSSELLQADERG
jgi:hypothetical protein